MAGVQADDTNVWPPVPDITGKYPFRAEVIFLI